MGWIKIDRKLTDHWLWEEKPFSKGQAWVDLLLLASWGDGEQAYKGRVVKRTQCEIACSLTWLARRWGWSREKIRGFIKRLENDEMIELNTTASGSIIRITNYKKYQAKQSLEQPTNQSTKQPTNQSTQTLVFSTKGEVEQPTNQSTKQPTNQSTNKEVIRSNKNNNIIKSLPEELQGTVVAFMEHRKKIKRPLTDHALELILNKANQLGGGNTEKVKAVIEQSIERGWVGVFPLKEDKNQNKWAELWQDLENQKETV